MILIFRFAKFIASMALIFLFIIICMNSIGTQYVARFSILHLLYIFIGGMFIVLNISRWGTEWRISQRSGLLIIFFLYASLNYIYDNDDFSDVWATFFGSTGGMVYGVVFGLIFATAIKNLISERRAPIFRMLFKLGVIFLFVFAMLRIYRIYSEESFFLRTDIFLTTNQDVGYQRIGSYIFLNMIALGLSLVTLSIFFRAKYLQLALLAPFSFISYYSIMVAQIIGSNSGAVTTMVFFILTVWGIFRSKVYMIKSNSIYNIKILLYSMFVIGSIVFIFVNYFLNINYESMRLFGFGDSESSSFMSRWEIFKNNTLTHFLYSPVFGNTEVDKITTGKGTYVHSILLSVLTHLGIVGFIIFVAFNIKLIKSSKLFFIKNDVIRENLAITEFLKNSFIIIFILGVFSAFFVWLPYWFMVGLYLGGLIYGKH